MNAPSAAPDMKTAAVDAKSAPSASALAKGKKAEGKASLAQTLSGGSRKGTVSFARIMSAKLGARPGGKLEGKAFQSVSARAPAGQKNTPRGVQTSRSTALLAFQGEKSSGTLPSRLGKILDQSEKAALEKEEKPDGKKKGARPIVHPVGAAVGPGDGNLKAVEGSAPAGEKPIEAVTAHAHAAGRPAEARPIVLVHVVDLRKRTTDKALDSGVQKPAQSATAAKEGAPIFMQQPSGLKDAESGRAAPAPASGTVHQSGLERLRETAGAELIRASQLVLRDGGGEIRLVLKPESLGSVRIRMNLVDNKIEGRIIVDSPAVKQVMDQNIDALSRALTAGGFQASSLEVSVGGQNADNGRQMQEPPDQVRRVAALGFEHNIPGEESLSMGDLLVNLFV